MGELERNLWASESNTSAFHALDLRSWVSQETTNPQKQSDPRWQDEKKEIKLPAPDEKIIKQWLKAVEEGDMTKQGLYLSIYDNQKLHDALKK